MPTNTSQFILDKNQAKIDVLIYGATISLQTKFSLSAEAPVLADGGSLKWLIGIYCHISCKEESKVIKVILKVFIIEQFIVRPVLGPGQEVTRCSGNTVQGQMWSLSTVLGSRALTT